MVPSVESGHVSISPDMPEVGPCTLLKAKARVKNTHPRRPHCIISLSKVQNLKADEFA